MKFNEAQNRPESELTRVNHRAFALYEYEYAILALAFHA